MMKVLVIEDEQPVRDQIIEALIFNGFTAQGALNGKVGVKLAKQIQPDVVLCDVTMEEMDGFGVLEALRHDSTTAALPFIFITAHSDRQSMRKGMELGADDYLTKPFSNKELLEAIHARLSRINRINSETENRLTLARQNLIDMISQRIQRPLESVNNVLEVVSQQLRQLTPADMQQLLDSATGDSRRIGRLVEQIALYVRLDGGLITSQTVAKDGLRLPLRDISTQALDKARTVAETRSDLEFHFEDDHAPALVKCDPETLCHALAELIINAMTYSPRYGAVVLSQWVEENKVWFSVTDHGAGMSPRHAQAAMGEGEEKTDGLGLKLVRGILEAHGGGFALHSGPGEGTTAAVWLPLSK